MDGLGVRGTPTKTSKRHRRWRLWGGLGAACGSKVDRQADAQEAQGPSGNRDDHLISRLWLAFSAQWPRHRTLLGSRPGATSPERRR